MRTAPQPTPATNAPTQQQADEPELGEGLKLERVGLLDVLGRGALGEVRPRVVSRAHSAGRVPLPHLPGNPPVVVAVARARQQPRAAGRGGGRCDAFARFADVNEGMPLVACLRSDAVGEADRQRERDHDGDRQQPRSEHAQARTIRTGCDRSQQAANSAQSEPRSQGRQQRRPRSVVRGLDSHRAARCVAVDIQQVGCRQGDRARRSRAGHTRAWCDPGQAPQRGSALRRSRAPFRAIARATPGTPSASPSPPPARRRSRGAPLRPPARARCPSRTSSPRR